MFFLDKLVAVVHQRVHGVVRIGSSLDSTWQMLNPSHGALGAGSYMHLGNPKMHRHDSTELRNHWMV